MKKLLVLLLAVLLINQANAQCTPEANMGGAIIYPEKLAFAMAGIYYSQVLSFRVPKDTSVIVNGNSIPTTVDSAKLIHIAGIPPGYNYACNNSSCLWLGGTKGCALLSGVSDSAGSAVGEYPIKVYIGTWARAAATSFFRVDSSSSYTFKVVSYNGMFEITETIPLEVYPNPNNGTFKIMMRDINSDNNHLQIMDLSGRMVYEKSFSKPANFLTTEEVSIGSQPKGLYLVQLLSGDKIFRSKINVGE